MAEEIKTNSCIHGYHIFKNIGYSSLRNGLNVKGNQETQEIAQCAEAIYKGDEIVGQCAQADIFQHCVRYLSGTVEWNSVFYSSRRVAIFKGPSPRRDEDPFFL